MNDPGTILPPGNDTASAGAHLVAIGLNVCAAGRARGLFIITWLRHLTLPQLSA